MLFFLALEMILGIKIYKDDIPETASIVPLAFPIIAGAGTMTTLLSIRAEFAILNVIIAIILNMVLVYVVLKNTHRIEKFLGQGGIGVLRRFSGSCLQLQWSCSVPTLVSENNLPVWAYLCRCESSSAYLIHPLWGWLKEAFSLINGVPWIGECCLMLNAEFPAVNLIATVRSGWNFKSLLYSQSVFVKMTLNQSIR